MLKTCAATRFKSNDANILNVIVTVISIITYSCAIVLHNIQMVLACIQYDTLEYALEYYGGYCFQKPSNLVTDSPK